jgi:RNA-directed DNA polymerase
VALRKTHEWCVKTDIQAFFDRIQRNKLKSLVRKRLGSSSLIPLLFAAIDREVKPANLAQASDVEAAGIKQGIGIRQGMPLSPLLANFSLSGFDATCKGEGIKLIRYADDVLTFFKTKEEAQTGFDKIKAALKSLELQVPELGEAKTELISVRDPVSFLVREIIFLDSVGDYVSRVGNKKLLAIKSKLTKSYSLETMMREEDSLNEAVGALAATIRSYLGTYKDAQDFAHFESEIRGHFRSVTTGWFKTLFGEAAIEQL